VNHELEAFSYSVSHDLRAPLRAMSGYSQVLIEDYATHLDSDAKNFLERILVGSQQMGKLIDALLQLSRLSRTEMQYEQINLSEMATAIAAELKEQFPERDGEFIIQDGLVDYGDSWLIHVALNNLLGNAWKFASKQSEPRIEFGVTEQDGQKAYFVRDNGVGFDMAYANKLFGTFQRLHAASEFEGTGIGLATVERVVRRHNGKIWAEAAVNKGATFYFCLGWDAEARTNLDLV
jgi:light-regulated signal transduction histidine kinase (bacteriophytochrome)